MSIEYYNRHAKSFIQGTFEIDFSYLTDRFLSMLPARGTLLDLGCGSGRDAIYFESLGYKVYAVDGSVAMIDHVRQYMGDRAILSSFETFETGETYHGIWASASLLHVAPEKMTQVLGKYRDMLKPGGIMFISYKKRRDHFVQEDRFFTCYDMVGLGGLLKNLSGIEIIDLFETEDVREEKAGDLWVNCFFKRLP